MFPKLLEFGAFTLPTYGVLIGLGFLAGLSVASRLARRSGLDPERLTAMAVVLLISAIVGAKVFMFVDNWSYYAADPGRLFTLSALRSGGVFYGGLLSALVVSHFYTRRYRLPWLATADAMAPGLAFGHGIGKVGCFAAGCCWGQESHALWAVTFTDPAAHGFTGVPLHVSLHPTQLYEALGSAAIGLVLLWLFVRAHPSGAILGSYLVLYSGFRFGVEFFRDDGARTAIFGDAISSTQVVALGLVILGIWLLRSAPRWSTPEPARAGSGRNRRR